MDQPMTKNSRRDGKKMDRSKRTATRNTTYQGTTDNHGATCILSTRSTEYRENPKPPTSEFPDTT